MKGPPARKRLRQHRARPYGSLGVSPVVAVILMVAITVVLATVVYFTVSQLSRNVNLPPPFIQLVPGLGEPANRTGYDIVAGGDTHGLWNFAAYVVINGTPDSASRLEPLQPGTVGNLSFSSFDDRLTTNDRFSIEIDPSSVPRTYQLILVWTPTGAKAASVTFVAP